MLLQLYVHLFTDQPLWLTKAMHTAIVAKFHDKQTINVIHSTS